MDFTNEQFKQMREYFNSLDLCETGTVGFEAVEETLISLGLLKTKQEVKQVVKEIMPYGNNHFDFESFM